MFGQSSAKGGYTMRRDHYKGSGWKFLTIMFGIFLAATVGLIGCGGGGGSNSLPPVNPPVNEAPVITSTAPQNAIEEVKYSYNPVATDSNPGDTMTWSLANQPVDMTINSATGSISWTPTTGTTSSDTVTLTVTDSGGLTDTETFTISVVPAVVILPPAGDLSVNISSFDTSNCATNEVGVILNVLDETGEQLTDNELAIGDFDLTYDGGSIALDDAIYRTVNEPLSIALVMDDSGSLTVNERTTIQNAVVDFINALAPNDAAEVIKFKDTIAVMQAFTTDKQALVKAVLAKFPNPALSGSVLYEAITQGIMDAEVQIGRKAVIAITDGDATASPPFDFASVIAEAERTGIPVYTIGLGQLLNPAVLSDIARETGGVYYDLDISAAVFQAYASLQTVLREEWVLSFTQPLPGGSHDIGVDVTFAGATGSDLKTMVPLCP